MVVAGRRPGVSSVPIFRITHAAAGLYEIDGLARINTTACIYYGTVKVCVQML